MGCKLSLPFCRWRGLSEGHERLEEDDERYFLKVQSRNKASIQIEKTSLRKNVARQGEAVGQNHADFTENVSTIFEEDKEVVSGTLGRKQVAPGPLLNQISPPSGRRNNRKHILSVQTARSPIDSTRQSRIGAVTTKSFEKTVSLLNLTSRTPSQHVHNLGSWSFGAESQFDTSSDVSSEVFDSLLPNGMIWDTVKRDGKITAVAMSHLKSIHFGNSQTGDLLLLSIGTDDGKVCVVEVLDDRFAKEGKAMASTASHRLRNLGEAREVMKKGRVRSLDFSKDGRFLAVGGDDCKVSIYKTKFEKNDHLCRSEFIDLDLVGELERVDRIYAARFSPKGDLLAVGGFDSLITVTAVSYECDNGIILNIIAEVRRPGLVLCVDWRPDGEALAIGGTDKCACILNNTWNITGEIHRTAIVESIKWNPDGLLLAVACGDIVAVVKGENLQIINELEFRHRAQIPGNDVSDVLVGAPNCKSPRRLCRVNSVCWSPDGSFLALGGSDGCCEIVESRGLARVHEIQRLKAITSLSWGEKQLPSGDYARYLAIGGDDNCVAIMKAGIDVDASSCLGDVSSAASSSLFSASSQSQSEWVFRDGSFIDADEQQRSKERCGLGNKVTCIAFSRGRKSIASPYFAFATDGCLVSVTNTKKWESIARLEFVKPMRSIQFANTSSLLVLGGDDATIYVVSVSTQQLVAQKLLSAPICAVRFSWGDERLAVALVDGLLALLNPKEGFELAGEIDSNDSSILALDWSSKNLGIGRSDGSIAVHETDKLFGNFLVPQFELRKRKPIRSLSFGVNGRFLAVGGDDGKLSVYSEKGDWVLCHQIRIDDAIKSVNWSPNGRYLGYSAASFTQICKVIDTILWAEVNELQAAMHHRDMSPSECQESTCLSWNANGSMLAVGGANGIFIFDSALWKFVVSLKAGPVL